MRIREYLKEHILLFDGAFGTYYTEQFGPKRGENFSLEELNLFRPDRVRAIHMEYLSAGAHAMKTNTFGAYPQNLAQGAQEAHDVIRAGLTLARESLLAYLEEKKNSEDESSPTDQALRGTGEATASAEEDYFIFADLGPAPGEEEEERISAYRSAIDCFLEEGARYFLFETLPEEKAVLDAVRYLKEKCPEAYLITSFAVMPDGFSREGRNYRDMLAAAARENAVDAVGLNCMSSVRHMDHLVRELVDPGKPLLLMPNAGYPVVRGYRTVFEGNVDYFAEILTADADQGVSMVGGCCGTTPDYIRALAGRLCTGRPADAGGIRKGEKPYRRIFRQAADAIETRRESRAGAREFAAAESGNPDEDQSVFYQKLLSGRKVIAVELDSPKGCDVSKFMEAAQTLKEAGTDILTISDNPIAKARMDSSLVAGMIRQRVGMDALPHMTCRDRNINATKSLLLGNYAQGIRDVLVITGDPIPSAQRDEVKMVYQFNSRKMMAYIQALGREEGVFPHPMHIYGALNVNARNFGIELERARQKMQAGAVGFLTQPALTSQAIANMQRASDVLRSEDPMVKILGGIIPVVSEKNGRFMQSEVSGIDVPDSLIERYVGKDRAACEKIAVISSLELAEAMTDAVDGYYLVTPFMRAHLIRRIMENLPR